MQCETEGGRVYPYLHERNDAAGVFLESAPEPEPPSRGTKQEMDEKELDETSEVKTLKDTLNEAEEKNAALAREVSSLRDGIQKQQDRVKELWKLNCEQLAEHNNIIVDKYAEILSLRTRLEEVAMHEHALGGKIT